MIDCQAVISGFFAAAAAATSKTAAARALDPLAASLRADLLLPAGAGSPAPMLRAVALPRLTGREGPEAVAARLRLRLDELALAKRFGDADDVRRMVDVAIGEIRQAAVAQVK